MEWRRAGVKYWRPCLVATAGPEVVRANLEQFLVALFVDALDYNSFDAFFIAVLDAFPADRYHEFGPPSPQIVHYVRRAWRALASADPTQTDARRFRDILGRLFPDVVADIVAPPQTFALLVGDTPAAGDYDADAAAAAAGGGGMACLGLLSLFFI